MLTSAKKRNKRFLVFLGVPQGSILCPIFFLICIDNLSNHTVSAVKQLAADNTLFFIGHKAKTSADELISHLKINMNRHP